MDGNKYFLVETYFFFKKTIFIRGGKYNMSSGSSTDNLNRHLKSHPEKIDPKIAKQAELMKKFLQSDDKIVSIIYSIFTLP